MTTFSLEALEARIERKISLPISGDTLAEMGDLGSAELVKGEIIALMPTGHLHGRIEALIAALLVMFNLRHKLGHVLTGEAGIYTGRNPDTVRGMDVAFISNERYTQVSSKSYLDVAPEIIIEIMSPSDSWSEAQRKINEYFAIEALQVWVVDPQLEQIHVYHAPDQFDLLTKSDTLTCEEILPNFSMALSDIFDS